MSAAIKGGGVASLGIGSGGRSATSIGRDFHENDKPKPVSLDHFAHENFEPWVGLPPVPGCFIVFTSPLKERFKTPLQNPFWGWISFLTTTPEEDLQDQGCSGLLS